MLRVAVHRAPVGMDVMAQVFVPIAVGHVALIGLGLREWDMEDAFSRISWWVTQGLFGIMFLLAVYFGLCVRHARRPSGELELGDAGWRLRWGRGPWSEWESQPPRRKWLSVQRLNDQPLSWSPGLVEHAVVLNGSTRYLRTQDAEEEEALRRWPTEESDEPPPVPTPPCPIGERGWMLDTHRDGDEETVAWRSGLWRWFEPVLTGLLVTTFACWVVGHWAGVEPQARLVVWLAFAIHQGLMIMTLLTVGQLSVTPREVRRGHRRTLIEPAAFERSRHGLRVRDTAGRGFSLVRMARPDELDAIEAELRRLLPELRRRE
ncbi:MAG: hypothetical protein AAF533_00365 [Acidobacteriota bacterium]